MEEKSQQNLSIRLDPHRHSDGAHLFVDYFDLHLRGPKFSFLQEIIEQFATIPYENISKIIKLNTHWDEQEKIRLPEEIIHEHISRNLGGTCFSLTFFLQTILTVSGFQCYPVMADMRSGRNIHCCVVVILNSTRYLVDPGYLLHRPMAIDPQNPRFFRTEFSGVELRYDPETGYYNLFTFDEKEIQWRYRFQDRPVSPEEFLKYWEASFWQPTLHGILLTKVKKEGLIYIHKTFMRETTFHARRNFNIKKNYHAAIQEAFGIDPQMVEQAQAALEENLARERELGLFTPNRKKP